MIWRHTPCFFSSTVPRLCGTKPQIQCYFESQRFSSVLNALQYDLILLTGDYPLIDFTLLGRYINFVQVRAGGRE